MLLIITIALILEKALQRKWRSLRDCFSRERRRLSTTSSGSSAAAAPKKGSYIYYDQLAFLHKVATSKQTSSNFSSDGTNSSTGVETVQDCSEEHDSSASFSGTNKTSKKPRLEKKRSQNAVETDSLVEVLKSSIQAREEREQNRENDDDRMFLLSLLQPIKAVPQELKLQVRSQIMQVIENYTYQHASPYSLSTYNQAITGPLLSPQPFSQQNSAKQPQEDRRSSGEITGFNYE